MLKVIPAELKGKVQGLNDAELVSVRAALVTAKPLDPAGVELLKMVKSEQSARRQAKAAEAGSQLLKRLL